MNVLLKFEKGCLQIHRELFSLATFSEFIQTQKRYPTSLDKIRILTWKQLAIFKPSFFLRTKLLKNLLLAKYFISIAATSKKLRNLAYQKPDSGGGDVKFPIYLKKAEDLLSFATYFWKPLVHVKTLFEWLFADKGG